MQHFPLRAGLRLGVHTLVTLGLSVTLAGVAGAAAQGSVEGHLMQPRLNVQEGELLAQRAARQWEAGKKEKALRLTRRALRRSLSAQNLGVMLYIGCAAEADLGDLDAAVSLCNRAVELTDGRDWRHLDNRAGVLARSGRLEEAISDFENAVALLSEQTAESGAQEATKLDRLRSRMQLAVRMQGAEGQNVASAAEGGSAAKPMLAGDSPARVSPAAMAP